MLPRWCLFRGDADRKPDENGLNSGGGESYTWEFQPGHGRAVVWLTVVGVAVVAAVMATGCDRDPDAVAACVQRCRASGGTYVGVLPEFPRWRESRCQCEFPIVFEDGGAR